jgi:hypothetical protein
MSCDFVLYWVKIAGLAGGLCGWDRRIGWGCGVASLPDESEDKSESVSDSESEPDADAEEDSEDVGELEEDEDESDAVTGQDEGRWGLADCGGESLGFLWGDSCSKRYCKQQTKKVGRIRYLFPFSASVVSDWPSHWFGLSSSAKETLWDSPYEIWVAKYIRERVVEELKVVKE